ncbi:alpha/beta fold hydrolase [Oceanicella actignis]|uniref:alpha/beta fold hydrolase n=1 Tax=Oceanicella actignis TaxID=1189325 RepID=UPI0011E658F5|nr:alpha/beta hydrolase [Oceanicella actignis]TYO88563.1 pimeloyl-ACP methyl ester carboxylesterase [Oceanicella actignis]
MSAEPRFFAAPDGRRLAYWDEGDGPPVLCLAGLSRNRRDFEPLRDALVGRWRVIRLDSRGRGRSERARDPLAEYAPAVEAADALALLDHLGLEGAAVVGTSRGGILGMTMAALRPGSVRALVLNDIGIEVRINGLRRIMGYLGLPPDHASFEEAARAIAEAEAARFPGVPLARWERHARAIFDDEGGRPVLSYDPRLRDATAAALAAVEGDSLSLEPLFAALEGVPLLTIRGENSDILDADALARMAALRPDMAHVTIADRGHAPFLDEPEAIAAIESLLARAR